jgi:hypothetical protein
LIKNKVKFFAYTFKVAYIHIQAYQKYSYCH